MERNLIDAELKNKKIKGYQKLKIKKTQKLICVTKTTTAQRRKLFFVKGERARLHSFEFTKSIHEDIRLY